MRRRVPPASLVLLVALALVAGACGSDDTSADSSTTSVASADVPAGATVVSVTDDLAAKPEIELEPSDEAPTELIIEDIVVGDGAEAVPGSTVEVQYVGQLTDGEQFDASWDNGQPFSFQLDAAMVIPGWDEGVAGMKVGGRRALIIPSDLAYGPEGRPPAIPPAATLIFVVDLLGVTEGPPDTAASAVPAGADVVSVSDDVAAKPVVELAGTDTAPVEVVVEDIVVGDGAEVGDASSVEIGYVGLLTDGTEFDSSWDGGSSFSFTVGGGRVIPGFDEGVRGMKVGGRRVLTIPAADAYGTAGTPDGAVPPDATLVFVIDLLSGS